jgi:hypothetical protein
MNIISNVILCTVGLVVNTIFALTVFSISFYTIGWLEGFVECFIEILEDFINTRKNK